VAEKIKLLSILGDEQVPAHLARSVIEERVIRNNKGEYSTGEAKDFVDVLLEIQNGKEAGSPLQRDSLKAILLVIYYHLSYCYSSKGF